MRIPTLLLLAILAAGCGGGPLPTSTLGGQLRVIVDATALELEALRDLSEREPDGTLASTRLSRDEPAGVLDADRDRIDVFRYVASRERTICARLECDGLEAEVVLFDLERGSRGHTLAVSPGTVYDVIVSARSGAGRYRVRIEDGELPGTPDLPPGYLPDEALSAGPGVIAAPAAGCTARDLAVATGLEWVRGGDRLCLLRPRGGGPSGLPDLLALCARLEAEGLARYAEPNLRRRLALLPDDPMLTTQWALQQIRAPAAWEQVPGPAQVVVGVVDSGVHYGHPDLVGRVLPGYDFVDDDADPGDLGLNGSHGTSVASLIAAIADNGEGIAGVSREARILPARAFDTSGHGDVFDIAQAIRYAAGLDNSSGLVPALPAQVLNLSFASAQFSTVEADACAAARAAGVLLVAAAGNDSSLQPRYPAAYPDVVAVAATRSDGAPASYTNYGSWIDLAAPGGESDDPILAARFTGYGPVVGSSFSVPHVAGVAALLLSARPLVVDELEALLLTTARPVGPGGLDDHTGHGIVDAYGAILATLDLEPLPLVPYEQVEVRLLYWPTAEIAARTTTSEGADLVWTLEAVPAGWYVVEAGTDRDLDGEISDPGEMYGRWRSPGGDPSVDVRDGLARLDLDIPLRLR